MATVLLAQYAHQHSLACCTTHIHSLTYNAPARHRMQQSWYDAPIGATMYYDASAESWRMDEVIPQLPYVNGSLDIQVYSLPKVCHCVCVRASVRAHGHNVRSTRNVPHSAHVNAHHLTNRACKMLAQACTFAQQQCGVECAATSCPARSCNGWSPVSPCTAHAAPVPFTR